MIDGSVLNTLEDLFTMMKKKGNRVMHRSDTNHLRKMLRSLFFFIFTVIIINVDCTIPIGYIQNETCVSIQQVHVTLLINFFQQLKEIINQFK
jgi:hypothetical protein